MSRKHPQNGPSFSKAPYKKAKPLTDEELAQSQALQKEREEDAKREGAKGRRFSKAVRNNGGTIPISGGNAETFWSDLKIGNSQQPAKSQK
jgi:hypothetical protein